MGRRPEGGGRLVVGGRHVLAAAAEAHAVREIYCDPTASDWLDAGSFAELPRQAMSSTQLRERFAGEAHQGVVTELDVPAPVPATDLTARCLDGDGPLLVLEELQDPQNLGSIFRAAAALGAAGIVLPKNRSTSLTAAVIRASVGCVFAVPHAVVGGIPNFLLQQCADLQTIATVAEGGVVPGAVNFRLPTAIVLGSEGRGLKPLTTSRCDVYVSIPMAAAESLNVGQAAVVFLYEALRARLDT